MSDRLKAQGRIELEAALLQGEIDDYRRIVSEAETMRAREFGRLLRMVASWIGRTIKNCSEALARARAANELAALDDRTLADIGIARSDIPAFVAGRLRRLEDSIDPREEATPEANPEVGKAKVKEAA